MSSLQNKRILLGISGSIAAYKSASLVRLLKQEGADVRVVMTESAKAFITPMTMQALSGHEVADELIDEKAELAMGHIQLARWADLFIIAPATANLIAKLANGIADDLLSTIHLACKAPIFVAPAMNQQMWANTNTKKNIANLQENATLLGPDEGEQACGDLGLGRMMEAEAIVPALAAAFSNGCLSGKRVMITAGPTREAIDPVRFISNHSSGKMGYAIAEAAFEAGAIVTVISGPVHLKPIDGCQIRFVISAEEMYYEVMDSIDEQDVFIGCAAVANYSCQNISNKKMKHDKQEFTLSLVPTKDIIADVANREKKPYVVGFAAETENVLENARDKLKNKQLDMIVANHVGIPDQGFNSDMNEVDIFSAKSQLHLGLSTKTQIARHLIKEIALHYSEACNLSPL
jgi:phosphopantothenoylcysteine decarboxylase/phosphopantothenate--cysteine ligase